MRHLLPPLFLLLSLPLAAQDTLRVQTLTFDSITTRRGWWVFPDSTHTFRKVLMHHTLKCDPATTQDAYDCGEWDYLTYNFIHDHTGVLDSNALQHPYFMVGNTAPDSVETVPGVPADIVQVNTPVRSILNVFGESDHTVGTADTTDLITLNVDQAAVRSQFLFTAAELAAAGVQPGVNIDRLRFQTVMGGAVERLTVRTKHTGSMLAGFDETGLTTVFDQYTTAFGAAGVSTIDLLVPFQWNGTNNIVIDIATEKGTPWWGAELSAQAVAPGMAVQERGRDGHVRTGNDFIGVTPDPLATLSDQVTILFRTWGDDLLPINTTMLEARDAMNRRILNVHLPWGDGRVYWDAGNDGGGFDRIDKPAAPADIEGQWTHWAFTKNTATGSMKIYKNGVLWHSGTGKTKPLNGIVRFNIAADADRNIPWPGLIDDFAVFSVELDAPTIAAWAYREIDATHPQWSNALYSLPFDEPSGSLPHRAENGADSDAPAWLMGTVQRSFEPATALGRSSAAVNIRPVVTFTQGSYDSFIDSSFTVNNSRPHPGVAREIFQVSGNGVVPVDTVFGGLADTVFTYLPNGQVGSFASMSGDWHVNDTLHYFGVPFEVVDNWEIGRYITPYGIGLSLGPDGFRWTYDVTDYQYLLHDSVELSAGNQQELIDLEFEMIEGTPPRELVRHQRPWGPQRSYSYAGLSDDTQLAPVTVDLDPAAAQWVVRSRFTGHGHNSNDGSYPHCCEWKDNTHSLTVNGAPADDWHIWQTNDCALNPVYPQGGTWPGAREGWCPGDVVKDHWTDITPLVGGSNATLDYQITPVPANNLGMGGGNYVVNMDLYEFGPATHSLDAEIYEVKRPTNWEYRGRENPICYEPVVTLRNAGATELTGVTFTYSVSGGPVETHAWTGTLKHMESTDVTLPVPTGAFWIGDGQNLFSATVNAPNGGVDQYADNDSHTAHFELPVIYDDPVKVYYKTNNRPWENEVVIKDLNGAVIYQKDWGTLTGNTTYTDTLHLTPGCYTLEMLDTENDGLSYWADPGAGSGFLRLRKWSGGVLKNFLSEFGRGLHWSFTLSDLVGVGENNDALVFSIAPNPGTGAFLLHTEGIEGLATIEVFNAAGARVLGTTAELTGSTRTVLDLSDMESGLYLVRMECEGRTAMRRVARE